MAECKICGTTYGMFGGGPEPYTGEELSVCSPCGEILKTVDSTYKKKEFAECRVMLQKLMYRTKNPETNAVLVKYSQSIMEGNEVFEKMKQEEADKGKELEELLANRKTQYKKNAYYEYCIETIADSKFSGAFNKDQAQQILTEYALEGWRLHTAFSNELGKNALAAMGLGVNATVEETILIFERCIKEKSA